MENKIKCPYCKNNILNWHYEYITTPLVVDGEAVPRQIDCSIYKVGTCSVCFAQVRIVEKELTYIPKDGNNEEYVEPKERNPIITITDPAFKEWAETHYPETEIEYNF